MPVVKHSAGEVALTAGSKTNGLLFLKSGTVEIVKDGVRIARVNAPGSVFGEQSTLLDQPHTADVRTLEQSEFYVTAAPAIRDDDSTVALHVTAILARRLDGWRFPTLLILHYIPACALATYCACRGRMSARMQSRSPAAKVGDAAKRSFHFTMTCGTCSHRFQNEPLRF